MSERQVLFGFVYWFSLFDYYENCRLNQTTRNDDDSFVLSLEVLVGEEEKRSRQTFVPADWISSSV